MGKTSRLKNKTALLRNDGFLPGYDLLPAKGSGYTLYV
jgi:hypothetical protein